MHPSGSRYQTDGEGATQGHCTSLPHMVQELKPRLKKGKNYIKKYLAEEEAALRGALRSDRDFCDLDEIEISSTISGNDGSSSVIQKLRALREEFFRARPQLKSNLIIDDFKKQILSEVEENEVVVLTGPTGCGKSTQVPQYILEASIRKLEHCNIVATQPRRVAAIGIARRICESREWDLGKLCGFKVGLKDRTSPETLLTFMTTGVLLQTLINKKSLSQFTHIILDEIHERDQSMDFLLIVIKKLLSEDPSNTTKVILMSATVDAKKFASYFQKNYEGELVPCPVVTIDRPTKYKVDIHYLDDLSDLGPGRSMIKIPKNFTLAVTNTGLANPIFHFSTGSVTLIIPHVGVGDTNISERAYDICIKLVKEFERLEKNQRNKNAVLIFLPGIYEIEHLYYKLTDPKVQSNGEHEYKWSLLPLHSSVTTEEQVQVFLPSKPGCRKIILSTNIAESSITVPGVKYVIDFCLMKRMKNDPSTNFNGLQLCWASKANCIQRAGRVGRLMDGKVYRMVHKSFYEELDQESKPEMLDAPLDRIILQTKMLDMGEPKALLALALDPPDLSDIEWTILTLKEAGGLLRYRGGVYTPFDGDITFLGCLMAVLPVDIHITKLIAMGHIFGCLTECIIMGAAMNTKNVFNYPFRDRLKAYELKCSWAESSFSDCIALLNVYNIWKHHREDGYFERSKGDDEIKWAARHFLHLRVLKETNLLVEEIKLRLKEYNVEEIVGKENTFNNEFERILLLKVAMAGAFYPHYYCPGYRYGESCEEEAVKELGEQNPFTTVVLHGFPSDQPMELYFDMIKDYLSDWGADMRLHPFGCSKILVEFRHWQLRMRLHGEKTLDVMPAGKIPVEVYRALKTRHLKKPINIKLLPPYEAKIRAGKLGFTCWNDNANGNREKSENFLPCPLPTVKNALVQIVISHVVDPGHFWALYAISVPTQDKILSTIEKHLSKCRPFEKTPIPGEMCIAPLCKWQETRFYRARIEFVGKGSRPSAKVFFVDQGCYSEVDVSDIRQYGPDLVAELREVPGQAFECVLNGIRPSSVADAKGLWTKPALHFFKKLIRRGRLYGQIYSVVRGVVSMELHNVDNIKDGSNINEILIEENYAERTDESHFSSINNKVRSETPRNDCQNRACKDLERQQFWATGTQTYINERELTLNVQLKGPTSPLEMTLYPCTRSTLGKNVVISEDSVNSVLLNTEPRDRHDRLIIAGSVNHNPDGSKLIINQTTVMPNLRGLPAIIHLMFSPEVEFRVDKERTKYTGILCGLGVDSKGRPLFPEHDIEVRFDSEITFGDYLEVNYLRSLMSVLLRVGKQKYYLTRSDVIEYQKKIRSIALKLLTKKRRPVEVDPGSGDYDWRRVAPDLLPPCEKCNSFSKSCTYPPHPGVSLKGRVLN